MIDTTQFSGFPNWARGLVNLPDMDEGSREGSREGFRRFKNFLSESSGYTGAGKDLEQVRTLRLQLRRLEKHFIRCSGVEKIDSHSAKEMQQSLMDVCQAAKGLSTSAIAKIYGDSVITKEMLDAFQSMEGDIRKVDPYNKPASQVADVYEKHLWAMRAMGTAVDDNYKLTKLKIQASRENSRAILKKHWEEHPGKSWAGFRKAVADSLNQQDGPKNEVDMAFQFMAAVGSSSQNLVGMVAVHAKETVKLVGVPLLNWTKFGANRCIAFAFDKKSRQEMMEKMRELYGASNLMETLGDLARMTGFTAYNVEESYKRTERRRQSGMDTEGADRRAQERQQRAVFSAKCQTLATSLGALPTSAQARLRGNWRDMEDTGRMSNLYREYAHQQRTTGRGLEEGLAGGDQSRKEAVGHLYQVISLDTEGSLYLQRHLDQAGNVEQAQGDLESYLATGKFTGNEKNFNLVMANLEESGQPELSKAQTGLRNLTQGQDDRLMKSPDLQKLARMELDKLQNQEITKVIEVAIVSSNRLRTAEIAINTGGKAHSRVFSKILGKAQADYLREAQKEENVTNAMINGEMPPNRVQKYFKQPDMIAVASFAENLELKRKGGFDGEPTAANALVAAFNELSNENRAILLQEMVKIDGKAVEPVSLDGRDNMLDLRKKEHLEGAALLSHAVTYHAQNLESSLSGVGENRLPSFAESRDAFERTGLTGFRNLEFPDGQMMDPENPEVATAEAEADQTQEREERQEVPVNTVPETSVPETPEVVTPETATPEVVTPEVVNPEVVTPEVATPEVVNPEVVTPETATPEVVTPETGTSEGTKIPTAAEIAKNSADRARFNADSAAENANERDRLQREADERKAKRRNSSNSDEYRTGMKPANLPESESQRAHREKSEKSGNRVERTKRSIDEGVSM